MEAERISFDAVLADAQAKGFAEADPTDDLDGYDARAKLCVLARIGLHVALRPTTSRAARSGRSRTSTSSTRGASATRSARSRASSTTTAATATRSVDAAVEPALVKNGSVLVARARLREPRADARRARLGDRLLRPRRRRRSDRRSRPVRRPVDRAPRVAAGWFGEVADDRPAHVESPRSRRTTSAWSSATSRASSPRSPTRWPGTT
jgi:hypothetical protein